MSAQYRWFLFDLDTKGMENVLGSQTKGYGILRQWFTKHGFEHKQGSVYRTLKPMARSVLGNVVDQLGQENPWLATTVNNFAVTSSGAKDYDFTASLRAAASAASKNVAGANNAGSATASAKNVAAAQLAISPEDLLKQAAAENVNVND